MESIHLAINPFLVILVFFFGCLGQAGEEGKGRGAESDLQFILFLSLYNRYILPSISAALLVLMIL